MVKKRSGAHEQTIRELVLGAAESGSARRSRSSRASCRATRGWSGAGHRPTEPGCAMSLPGTRYGQMDERVLVLAPWGHDAAVAADVLTRRASAR